MVALPASYCGKCGKILVSQSDKAPLAPPVRPRSHDRKPGPSKAAASSASETPKTAPPAASDSAKSMKPGPSRGRRPARAGSTGKEPPAGFWIRFVAYLIDNIIVGVPALMLVGVIFLATRAENGEVSSLTLLALTGGTFITFLFFAIYHVYFWGVRGATPGKELLNLGVVTETGEFPIGARRALLRLVGYLVNSFTFGIGFLLIAFSSDKRGLHDRLAETSVVRRSS